MEDELVYLAVGKIRKPHGIKGELLMEILSDFPDRIIPGKRLFIGERKQSIQIETLRPHNKLLLIKLKDHDNLDSVKDLRNNYVFVKADEIPDLPDGEYYHHDLIGLKAFLEDKQCIGTVKQILETGANDVYFIESPTGKEILVPALESVILDIDIMKKEMIIRPLPGMDIEVD